MIRIFPEDFDLLTTKEAKSQISEQIEFGSLNIIVSLKNNSQGYHSTFTFFKFLYYIEIELGHFEHISARIGSLLGII